MFTAVHWIEHTWNKSFRAEMRMNENTILMRILFWW